MQPHRIRRGFGLWCRAGIEPDVLHQPRLRACGGHTTDVDILRAVADELRDLGEPKSWFARLAVAVNSALPHVRGQVIPGVGVDVRPETLIAWQQRGSTDSEIV